MFCAIMSYTHASKWNVENYRNASSPFLPPDDSDTSVAEDVVVMYYGR